MQIRLYQDTISLLNSQLNKIPMKHCHYHKKYMFLKRYYQAYIKNLINHTTKIKLREASLTKDYEIISLLDYRLSEKTCKLAANCIQKRPHQINQNILINNKSSLLMLRNSGIYKSNKISNDHEELSNVISEPIQLKKNKSLIPDSSTKKNSKLESQTAEHLDCEELSELSSSENNGSKWTLNKTHRYKNRIDCCYTEIKFEKTNKEHGRRWRNLFNNGILILDGKEYIFKAAKADLKFDRDQE